VIDQVSGFNDHNNCENSDFGLYRSDAGQIEERFGELLDRSEWVSLGGGIHFDARGVIRLMRSARGSAVFCERYGVQRLPGA